MVIISHPIEHMFFLLAGAILVIAGYLSLSILISDRESIEQNINRKVKDALKYLTLSAFAVILPSVSGLLHVQSYTELTKLLLKVSIGILWIVILYINLSMIIALWKADFRPKFKKELVDYAFYFAVLWLLFSRLDIDLSYYIIPGAIFLIILLYTIIRTTSYLRKINMVVFPVSLYNIAFTFGIFTIAMGLVLLSHVQLGIHAGFVVTGYIVFTAGLVDLLMRLRGILKMMED